VIDGSPGPEEKHSLVPGSPPATRWTVETGQVEEDAIRRPALCTISDPTELRDHRKLGCWICRSGPCLGPSES
jgi:hypothetical protein